jgi:hypothetical protein
MRVDGKVITSFSAFPAKLKVVATDVHDPFIGSVVLKEFIAEPEEGRVRQTIVL